MSYQRLYSLLSTKLTRDLPRDSIDCMSQQAPGELLYLLLSAETPKWSVITCLSVMTSRDRIDWMSQQALWELLCSLTEVTHDDVTLILYSVCRGARVVCV